GGISFQRDCPGSFHARSALTLRRPRVALSRRNLCEVFRMRRKILLVLFILVAASAFLRAQSAVNSQPGDAQVVRYHATIDTVKYVYGAAPPVARLKPGNILEANSLDCFGNALQKPGDS